MNIAILILALISVESGGNVNAVGDNGKAIGILQIHACVIADVNRVFKTDYRWPEDARDPAKSRTICELYIAHWGEVRFGAGGPTYEQAARIWNGGPNGYRRNATLSYWMKVRKHLP
jgi:soluble lytic murein transglycosylase-like protein